MTKRTPSGGPVTFDVSVENSGRTESASFDVVLTGEGFEWARTATVELAKYLKTRPNPNSTSPTC